MSRQRHEARLERRDDGPRRARPRAPSLRARRTARAPLRRSRARRAPPAHARPRCAAPRAPTRCDGIARTGRAPPRGPPARRRAGRARRAARPRRATPPGPGAPRARSRALSAPVAPAASAASDATAVRVTAVRRRVRRAPPSSLPAKTASAIACTASRCHAGSLRRRTSPSAPAPRAPCAAAARRSPRPARAASAPAPARPGRRARTPPPRARRCPQSTDAAIAATSATDARSRAMPRPSTASARIDGVPSRAIAPQHRQRLRVVHPREPPRRGDGDRVGQARLLRAALLREEQRLVLGHEARVAERAARDHRPRAERGVRVARREREERERRVLVLHVREHVDRDALLARVLLGQRVEQRLHGARPDARERGARLVRLLRRPVAHALHEPEGEAPVDLDEQPPVDGLLRLADGEREEVLLERLERPLAQVDLHRQPRRARDELLVRRAADDAPEQAVGLVGLPLATAGDPRARSRRRRAGRSS